MDLDDCYKKGMIRKVSINKELIKSLIEMSGIHEKTVNKAKINKENISSYLSLAYDSLREILEAICISKGYKVLSHVCIGELLIKIIDDFDYNEFDRMRYIRNGISYYGVKVEFEQGKKIIEKISLIRKKLISKYLKSYL